MDSAVANPNLVAGAEELVAALKSQQSLTNASRAALLRQVDTLRCGLQGPAEAAAFLRILVSSTFVPLTPGR